jgi:L-cysteate sulfo-lyase
VQSNHCRQTAAAAARHGLACALVLQRRVAWNHSDYERGGNVLLDRLAGAELHLVERAADLGAELERIARELRAGGRRPFVIPVGGSTPIGALGYVAAGLELLSQAETIGRPIDAILHASGSGGTQAGLLVALQASGADVPVIGISVSEPKAELEATVADLAARNADLLGTAAPPRAVVEVQDGYVGADYGLPTAGMGEAVRMCAGLEACSSIRSTPARPWPA